VDVFTVEVTPEQGEQLSLAATQGKLHFALRNVTDKNVVYTLGSTVPEMLEAYRPRMQKLVEPAAKMEPHIESTQRRSSKMDVINGTTVKQVSF
jgi:pilus assembly protein CpaB